MATQGSVVGTGSLITPGGAQGPPGSTGPPGINAYTITSGAFTVPPAGGTVVVTVANASWATVGQMIYIAGAGGANLAGALQVSAINGNQLTLLNPVPAPAIPLADTTQQGLLCKVSGASTDYIGGDNLPHPQAVSTDAGNIATLGSDKLILVPQSVLWNQRLRSFSSVGNPNFEVDQRNVGNLISPTLGVFALDRWAVTKVGTMVMATQQSPVPITGGFVVPGTNFRISNNFLAVTLTTQEASLAAGDVWAITQNIEGPLLREIVGDVSSVSLLVASTVAGLKFSVAIRDPGTTTKSLVKLFTIPNASTWTLIQLPNLPQFPSGNFSITPGTAGYMISICLASGTTYTAPATDTWQNGNFLGAPGMSNFAGQAVNSVFQIGFVQHEPGPLCTTLQDKPFSQNLDECLRYYQKTYAYGMAPATVTALGTKAWIAPFSSAQAYGTYSFYKPMAKAPTVTFYNHATGAVNSVRDNAGVDHASATANGLTDSGFYSVSFTTATTAAMQVFAHHTADTGW